MAMHTAHFLDRVDAGRQLAAMLSRYAYTPGLLVLALPRGGVPVAFQVARRLGAPLDVYLVRKLGVPGHEELAMGAIATGGVRVLNEDVIESLGVSPQVIEAVARAEQREMERREREYRGERPRPDVRGRTVILVDDGLATGASMRAAAQALAREGAGRIVVAVPVAPASTCDALRQEVDDVVCAYAPEEGFDGVGFWYGDFSQTSDEEVRDLLHRAHTSGASSTSLVHVRTGAVELEGELEIPAAARGVVLFAHGSGSSRHSPRNRFVARELLNAGLATLRIDLLTPEEEEVDDRTGHLRFDIPLLAGRLVDATDWICRHPPSRDLPVGLFGASTGGGAALVAAAERPGDIRAVVSRGGRPDLAGPALPHVRAPTLLVVGGDDVPVIGMNRDAMARMTGAQVRLEIVPGATHLFEEPGKLEVVARLARDWFLRHLPD